MTNEQTLFTPKDAQTEQQHALTSYLKTLEGEGIDVDRIELTESDDVELEYSMLEGTEHEQDQEWYFVVGAYVPVQEGGSLGDLKVTAHAPGDRTARGCVKAEWCAMHHDGTLTDEQYLSRVSATLEGVM